LVAAQFPSFSLFATDPGNRLRVQVGTSTTGGGGVSADRISGGTTTGLAGVSAAAALTKPRMGGANGQFRGWQANETITALAVNGQLIIRRAPGFPLGPAAGTAFTALAGDRFGFDTLQGGRTNFIDAGQVGAAPLTITVDETHRFWVPKKRASASDPITAGVGEETFTGTYFGDPSEFVAMEWAIGTPGGQMLLRSFVQASPLDLVLTPTGPNTGTWSQTVRGIPVGLNGRGAYAIGFRPVRQFVDPVDGLVRRTDPAWQCFSRREFYVTLNVGVIGQSNAGKTFDPVTGTNYPRADGHLFYTKADPPSVVRGSYVPNPQFWEDTSTTGANGVGNGRCTYVLGEYLMNLYNLPVSFEALAISARDASVLGPIDVTTGLPAPASDWAYIQTHHAFAGGAYDILYLSQGENAFSGTAANWLAQWRDVNIPAYRDPAMHGQPAGTVIPVLYAITGRFTGTPGANTDAQAQILRSAQYQLAAEVADCYLSHSYTGIGMIDTFHYLATNGLGYNEVSRRNVLTYNKIFNGGAYDGRGPIATSVERVAGNLEVSFDMNGATSLVARDGRDQTLAGVATALTSWQISTDNFSTTLPITSVEIIPGNKVRITPVTPLTAQARTRNHFGLNPDISSWPTGSYADSTFIGMMPLVNSLLSN
jgi:hypothetical protein